MTPHPHRRDSLGVGLFGPSLSLCVPRLVDNDSSVLGPQGQGANPQRLSWHGLPPAVLTGLAGWVGTREAGFKLAHRRYCRYHEDRGAQARSSRTGS